MDRKPDATAPVLVIGLGDYGRRLLWVLEQQLGQAGQEEAGILCPPLANGDFDRAVFAQGKQAAAALVIADGLEANSAVRLTETARALAANGLRAYVLLAESANVSTGARWAGAFAGSLLFPYVSTEEWRQGRVQMAEWVQALLLSDDVRALPDWQRMITGMESSVATPATAGACAQAA